MKRKTTLSKKGQGPIALLYVSQEKILFNVVIMLVITPRCPCLLIKMILFKFALSVDGRFE
jgi:hypothetical protein